ncbi:type II toxin-antitoxin system VapC family toxin [Rhizobium wuzhouense]|uniref:Ribonuclease VapC n=1 Tax=Rhizobium wuzhouense TaxID=1986026 RepID=A0ABX5NRQ1_9HYPH|nr:type II toxin-antitoxin system VapC family toxin [Rhizobium wuzhouense]PYB73019.1 VapC toxin family PIN domain ribonuclease [Rhizobium wuzhouense]
MIALDTSALIAIIKNEPTGRACAAVLAIPNRRLLLSAGTLLELKIVALQKKCSDQLSQLIASLNFEIVDLTQARAERAAAAYQRFGKGFHPAALNFGDCFSYATAQEFDCPLLYVGDDFARADVRSTLDVPRQDESL